MADRPDNPGVRVPPPALYALAVLIGYLLNRRWPLPIGGGVSVQALAWLLVGVWLVMSVSSIGTFRRSRTSIVPIRPATALVIAGPYRFTRNPMYLGLVIQTLGIAVWVGAWPMFAAPLALFLTSNWIHIPFEEAKMRRQFATDFDAYVKRVRRWV